MKRHILLFGLVICIAYNLSSQTISTADLLELDKYYEQIAEDWNVPGFTVAIVKDGEIVFSKGYGLKEVGKKDIPDGNTLYAIASNSKAFTSALVAMLVEEGKLGWNDKVVDYLPYFEVYDSWVSKEMTIRDLLCHRSGLGTFSGDVIWYKSDLTSKEIIERIKFLPKAYDFRSGYGYSNLMYITAGEIIKEVTGKPWHKIVQERILDPLAMDRTVTTPFDLDMKGNYATPHALISGKNVPIDWVDWQEIGALGGIISSVNDVAKWMIFNMNNGIIEDDTLLSAYSRNLIWTPHNNFTANHVNPNDFETNFNGYALGWSISDYRGNLRINHGGGYDGMISSVNMLPDLGIGVVVLSNGLQSPTSAISYYTLDKLLGVDGKDWSKNYLTMINSRPDEDRRITRAREARVEGTNPSLSIENYAGKYHSDIYGEIKVELEGNALSLSFEHAPELSASLNHWHYDVWEIDWDNIHAWFDFGTLKFDLDNNLNIVGMDFNVPNGDIFFEELMPKRIKK
jgi:CubicO group peptidase (beta-lactamase class C family)